MSLVAAAYRVLTGAFGAVAAPLGRALSPRGSPWRERWGGMEGLDRVAGAPWLHAASMGEAVAARAWGDALAGAGYRTPFLVTTRTPAGLDRVRREWGERAVAAMAPIDAPQAVRRLLREAAPMRLDILETELWPNLLDEAHRAAVPVVVVSGTVSPRTAARLAALGFAGERLFGPLHVLAQSEGDAARFRALGVAAARCAVVGDVKADLLPAAGSATDRPPGARRLVLFASARPGEEAAAAAVAKALASRPDASAWRFVVAPRHERAAASFRLALRRAGVEPALRDERSRAGSPLLPWADSLGGASTPLAGGGSSPGVGILATRGELTDLYPRARLALVGGTFAPYGGHNVLEPAAYGVPVLLGPHHESVESGVARLRSHGGGEVVPGVEGIAAAIGAWLDADAATASNGALAAASAARGAARRGLEQLAAWGLVP